MENRLFYLKTGKSTKKSFRRKMDINEFLTQCRVGGYFDLNDLACAILETNGEISLLPQVKKRPVTPEDLNLTFMQEYPPVSLIIDGVPLKENLKYAGKDEQWLQKRIECATR